MVSATFSSTEKSEMHVILDINNICTSGGTTCTSGARAGRHVINAITGNPDQITIRFYFSKYNNKSEIDILVEKLKEII